MFLRKIICCLLLLFLFSPPLLADSLVLKNGDKYIGTLANREVLRSKPLTNKIISILISTSGELKRFQINDVDYLVFQDQNDEQVIDLSSLQKNISNIPIKNQIKDSNKQDGELAIFLGLLSGGVGILHKFGNEEKVTITGDSIDYEKKSYNSLNYILMGSGALLIIFGLDKINSKGKIESKKNSYIPIVSYLIKDDNPGIHATYRFSF